VWDDLIALIPQKWIKNVSKSDQTIDTLYGSRIYVRGLDAPQRLEGLQYKGGIIDESSDVKPGTFKKSIRPALTEHKGWCWRIGVPKRDGIGAVEYKDWFDRGFGQDPEIKSFCWPSSSVVDPEEIEKAKKDLSPEEYREQFEASWLDASGCIFYSFEPDYNVRHVQYAPKEKILIGMDYNVSPMAWILCHKKNNELNIFDELFIRNTNTQKCLDILYSKYKNHEGGWEIYGDASSSSRKTSAAETDYVQVYNHQGLKRAGRTLHFPSKNPPVADRFAATNALLKNAAGERRCYIDPGCKNLINDLKSRYYKPGTREAADAGDLGHATDALGYIIVQVFPLRYEIGKSSPIIFGTKKRNYFIK
jgi:hypothetical protein